MVMGGWLVYTVNGVGEFAAAALFFATPSLFGFAAPLDANARFLFKSWAVSIAGFAAMTLAAAREADEAPEKTEAITYGAILYHASVAIVYATHWYSGVLLADWLFGCSCHCLGFVAFSHHLFARVHPAKAASKSKRQ